MTPPLRFRIILTRRMKISHVDVHKSISVQCSFPEIHTPPRRIVTPVPPVRVVTESPVPPSRYRQTEPAVPTIRKSHLRYLGKTPLWKFRPHSVTASLNNTSYSVKASPKQGHRRTVTRPTALRLTLPPYLQAKSLLPPTTCALHKAAYVV